MPLNAVVNTNQTWCANLQQAMSYLRQICKMSEYPAVQVRIQVWKVGLYRPDFSLKFVQRFGVHNPDELKANSRVALAVPSAASLMWRSITARNLAASTGLLT